ncbi:solute carrier organic anion transporter family member 4C1-like isoform X2 [Pecten maximus]|uniref:solute carrier organic anion transporter family member 4C1-like isoform X2 n=1 Tax=Pecten maximus TaxID=6579 RepID=UPI001458338E|nr:solute carrier organic anion transporter family member 4C1-like isoform X2 [Pecten maximus]
MSKTKKTSRSSLKDANDGSELQPLTFIGSELLDDVFDEASPIAEMEKHDKRVSETDSDPWEQNGRPNLEEKNNSVKSTRKVEVSRSLSLEDPDVRCGFGPYKPDVLQRFNNPKCLLAFLSFFAFIQGFVVNGINNVNTTSIERRFGLPSSKVGSISSAYDVSAAIVGLIISHFGSGRNKPKFLSLAAGSMAIGSFVMTLPHFTNGLYLWGENIRGTCSEIVEADTCNMDESLQNYLYVFLLGQALHGVGGTTLYIVGVSLMDDSVPATSSPMYIGIFYSFATFGPALGYIFGGQMLNVYVDFNEPAGNSGNLTPGDPRWVGAWWVGFLVASLVMVSVAIPMAAYGVELPAAKKVRDTRVSQMHNDHVIDSKSNKEIGSSLRDLPRSFWILLTNPAFTLITLAGAAEGLTTSGFSTFMPKLIQNQFGTTAAWASILGGIVAVPGAAGGQLISGYLCKRLNLKVRGMLRLIIVVCLVAAILDFCVWIRCEQETIVGVSSQYSTSYSEDLPNLQSLSCNSNCSCSSEFYQPVCSDQHVQYFSPCHAGCHGHNADRSKYTNCTCVSQYKGYVPDNITTTVTSGKCQDSCLLLYIFLPVLLFAIFFRFAQSPPALSVTLRCIHDKQRTFALGIQWFVVRLMGTVPGPIMFGSVIDSSCLVWQEKCGENTSCWIYDNSQLSRNFFIILFSVKVTTSVIFIIAYKLYKPPIDKSVSYVVTNGTKLSESSKQDDNSSNSESEILDQHSTVTVL